MADKKPKKRTVRNDNRDEHVRRAMFGRAGNRCMKPECRGPVSYTEPGTGRVRTTGEIAHIYGVKPKAERYVEDMKPAERDKLENLLVLCPTCHDIIDKPGAHVAFPATKLLKWHQDRQLELNRAAGRSPASFGFQELQRVVRLLPAAPVGSALPAEPPDIQEKLDWNGLSERVHSMVALGLERAASVADYLRQEESLRPGGASIIEGAIAAIYREHRARTDGDALYYALRHEIGYGLYEPAELSAADAVLSYFFSTCDVFERPE